MIRKRPTGFALAESFDSNTGLYAGLAMPGSRNLFGAITDQVLLVKPSIAASQQAPISEEAAVVIDQNGSSQIASPVKAIPDTVRQQKKENRFFGVYEVDPERYSRDLNRLSQEVLQHLSSVDDVELSISIEIHAASDEGFTPEKIRIILENARTLKFKQSSFETE